jgi:hypothetical protein
MADAQQLFVGRILFFCIRLDFLHEMAYGLGIEPASLALLIKRWIIHIKCNHNFAYGSQAEQTLAVPFHNEILMANADG